MASIAQTERRSCRVLVVDDHEMVRKGVHLILDSRMEQYDFRVLEAEDGSETIQKISKNHYDLILLDYGLPDIEGPELTERILYRQPGVHILGMSAFADLAKCKKMLRAGAKGFIVKNVRGAELLIGIQQILAGGTYFSAVVANEMLNEGFRKPMYAKEGRVIGRRELEVLQLIAVGKSNKEIAGQLFRGVRTIETHRKNLLRKLGVRNSADLVRVAYEMRLLL
jgi:two-component system response regulator NreC